MRSAAMILAFALFAPPVRAQPPAPAPATAALVICPGGGYGGLGGHGFGAP
ncbi:MAG: hypothetical protein ACKOSQ_02215 [Planctomycetaceae bacterium]